MQTGFPGGVAARSPDASEPSRQSLEVLMHGVAGGEVAALSTLYTLTAARVLALARFILHSKEDAEEIIVDVFTHVWQHATSYDAGRGTVMAWLSVMTRNRAIDRLRKRGPAVISLNDKQHESLTLSLVGTNLGPEQTLSLFELGTAVHRALQSLSSERLALLHLAFFEGLTHEEIAATMGKPLGTVKSLIKRSLAALQQHLTPET